MSSDPFQHMIRNNKTYGFTIAVKELRETVPNIFRYASAYKRMNNLTSQGLWEMFVEKPEEKQKVLPKMDPKHRKPLPEEILNTEPGTGALPEIDPEAMEGETYNMCHFWSNFEIARLDWFRSKEYNDFFELMDRSGGFWMERVSLQLYSCIQKLIWCSGETHQYIHLPRGRFSVLVISTTFVISVTDILPSSIAPPMRPLDNSSPESLSSRRRRKMKRSAPRKMSTGRHRIPQEKTALGVDVNATPTSST